MYYATALKKLQEMYGEKTFAKVNRRGRFGERRLDIEAFCEIQLMNDLANKFDKKTIAEKLGVNFKISEPLPDSNSEYKHYCIYSQVEEIEVWIFPGLEYANFNWQQNKESLGLDTHSFPWWLWKG